MASCNCTGACRHGRGCGNVGFYHFREFITKDEPLYRPLRKFELNTADELSLRNAGKGRCECGEPKRPENPYCYECWALNVDNKGKLNRKMQIISPVLEVMFDGCWLCSTEVVDG